MVHACVCNHFSHVQLFGILWSVACQAPLSMGFSSQEYWSGLPCPPPGDLPHPAIKHTSPLSLALQADSLLLSHQGSSDTHACTCAKLLQVMSDSATLWTVASQAPVPMGFFRQEYWSGLPCPPPGDLPDPGIEPGSRCREILYL